MQTSGSLIGASICLVIFVTALCAAPADLLPDAELFGKTIRSIEYDADRPLERARYDRSIGLKPGDILTRTGLKAAIQALYDTGSFSEIAAAAVPEGDGVQLEFHLRFSTYFSRFFISNNVDLAGRFPYEVMALPIGERCTVQKLEEARQAVLGYMRERGFYQAEVTARTARGGDDGQIDTTFEVQPGQLATIRSLVIRGVPPQESAEIRGRLKLKEGQKYQRDRFRKRLDGLKKYLVGRGFLEAELQLSDSYQPGDNSVGLDLSIRNFGQVRIEVEGFKIPKDSLRRLLPALSGEGLRPELLEEGATNLKEYLEEYGYPEAATSIQESRDSAGVRLVRYIIDRGRKVTVSEVRFHGNRAFSDGDLLKTIQIQPSRFLQKSAYSVSKLDADVEALQTLYRSAGYLDAAVVPLLEPLENGEKLRVTFDCAEGARARVRSVVMTGNQRLSAKIIAARMRLQTGEPYSPDLAEHDRQVILAAYNDAGFLQPAVTWQAVGPDKDDTYAIAFQIKEGVQSYVDRIVVLGRDRTRESVVEKRIKLKEDQPLSLGKMLETQQALYDTGAFDLVRVTPQNPESSAACQNVIVRLQEARPVTLRYGFGYQEREKVRGILELSDLNIFGTGRRADLRLRGSAIEQAGVLSFQQPQFRFLPVDSFFTLSGSKKKEISFDSRRLKVSYQYSRPISGHTWGLLRYSFTNVRVSQVTADLAREETPRNLSTISAFYVNDTRDSYLDPEKGFFTSTDLSLTTKLRSAALASGQYVSLFTQNSYYRKLSGPLLMASSLRFGLIYGFAGDRSIPLSERFFAGGGASLRGFDTDRAGPLGLNNEPIGGNALLIGNLELRVPLISRFQLAGFYDGGNVYPSVGAIRFSDFSHTVGAGLRVRTPFGPIRLDYGVNLNLPSSLRSLGYKQGHFFLTIGPPF
jgi:outer membrane protein insertion porin family